MAIKFPKLPPLKSLPKVQPLGRPQPKPLPQVRDGFERPAPQPGAPAIKDGSRASHFTGSGGVEFREFSDGGPQKLPLTTKIVKVMADVPEGARPERVGDKLKPEDLLVKVKADIPEGASPERAGDPGEKVRGTLDQIVKVMADVPEGARPTPFGDKLKPEDLLVKVKADIPEGASRAGDPEQKVGGTLDRIVKVMADVPEGARPEPFGDKLKPEDLLVKVKADIPEGASRAGDPEQKVGGTLDRIVKVMADVPEGARPEPFGDKLKPEDLLVKVKADIPEGASRAGDPEEKVRGTLDQIVKVKMDLPEGP